MNTEEYLTQEAFNWLTDNDDLMIDAAEYVKNCGSQMNLPSGKGFYALAAFIKDWLEERNPLGYQASMYSDFLRQALHDVDYARLTERLVDCWGWDRKPE